MPTPAHDQSERVVTGSAYRRLVAINYPDPALSDEAQPSVIGLGYWVVPSARQRGLGCRAAILASDWAIGSGGYARIEAWVEPGNLASQSVLHASGFDLEGRLRSFLAIGDSRSDALVYSRIAA